MAGPGWAYAAVQGCARHRERRERRRGGRGEEGAGGRRERQRSSTPVHTKKMSKALRKRSVFVSPAPAVPDAVLGVLGVTIVDAAFVLVVVVDDV